MPLDPDDVERRFAGCPFGVSARRINEHITLAQVNPFSLSPSSVRTRRDAAALIDLVRFDSPQTFRSTGLTLADGIFSPRGQDVLGDDWSVVQRAVEHPGVRDFIDDVFLAVEHHAQRRATRNSLQPFLASGSATDPFGLPGVRSRLSEFLAVKARGKAGAGQWLGTIRNLATKGLRHEELQRSRLIDFLEARAGDPSPLTGADLASAVDFSALRLSVVQSVVEARTQLRFEPVGAKALPKIKGEAKPQPGQRRHLRLFDRVLGYRIEEVEHPALWGDDRHWQAVTFEGKVLRNRRTRRSIFATRDIAVARAQEHAMEVLPRLLPEERWVDWSWTGGEDYRESLVTLSCFPTTFLSAHFNVRNVLAHVRCDVREGANGERVLLLHEVQSDWMQEMRRLLQEFGAEAAAVDESPFLHEWPALTLKLILLHAAHRGVDAVAWTRGAHHVHRYGGRGRAGLKELYDRTLPREANRMLKPFGVACGQVEVYVPDNFSIRGVEDGYEVRTEGGKVLGVAPSFEAARAILPDGAHERLYGVHGVRLDKATRTAILQGGFTAWG